MKKLSMVLLAVVFSFCLGITNVMALQYNSGEHIGTYDGNDNAGMGAILDSVDAWFLSEHGITREVDFDLYAKVDKPASSATGITVTYDDDYEIGTWDTDYFIEFYTVKASDSFALYWLDGGASSGLWSTEHIVNNGNNQPAISHLSGWNPIEPTPDPVPEPATMLLFGLGILGLAGVSRKKQ